MDAMRQMLLVTLALTARATAVANGNSAMAEQIHLAVTGTGTSMSLDFVSSVAYCQVEYAPNFNKDAKIIINTTASWFYFEIGFTHQVILPQLAGNTSYLYSIGCNDSWTPMFDFVNEPVRAQGHRIVFLADFGLENDVSMPSLLKHASDDEIDMLILGGDFACINLQFCLFEPHGDVDDFKTRNSTVGNEFMNALQPLAARKPFMPAPGNHEAHDGSFFQYTRRFASVAAGAGKASGSNSNFYYSFDMGLIHFIAIDTEVYEWYNETQASIFPFQPEEQLTWLERDLEKANASRSERPWIVLYGHKAWHMDYQPDEHNHLEPKLTCNYTGFTALAHKYKVDLMFAGHLHIYQRFLPVLGPKTLAPYERPQAVESDCVSEDRHLYKDCNLMTTIVAGSPGDDEPTTIGQCLGEDVIAPIEGTLANCSNNYGYGVINAVNSTHLHWHWLETGPGNGTVPHRLTVDELWLERSR